MASATEARVCPVVGTTNTILPPSHPDIDVNEHKVCPVTNATTDHHHIVHKHPGLSDADAHKGAEGCPFLKDTIHNPENEKLDEGICPVVGPVSTVLPPDHPVLEHGSAAKECLVTKAKVGHHEGKVFRHPNVEGSEGVCPVVGAVKK